MSRPKDHLNHLLFSSSHNDESHNSNIYDEDIEQCQQNFLSNINSDEHWRSHENVEIQFMQVNGPSVQFSQNFSQNSMMMSHRQDDDSREEKLEKPNKYITFYQDKKRQEIQFNEALQKELNSVRQQLQKSKFETNKLQSIVKGLEVKVRNKQQSISVLDGHITELQQQIIKLKEQKSECLALIARKDDLFAEVRANSNTIYKEFSDKQLQNKQLRQQIEELHNQINKLNKNLSVYNDSDRKLFDFKGKVHQQVYQSPINSKKNSQNDKELDKLKRQKNSLQAENLSIRDKLEERENRFRQLEEQNRKKISLKERKVQELEQKISQMREDSLKNKTQTELTMDKINSNLNSKIKEINSLNQKLAESQKRIKSLLDQCKKKDEKIRDVNFELIQKSKFLNQRQKQRAELSTQQQFDHHMIEEKDKEIQRLLDQKKMLKQQLENQKMEKIEKIDKNDKNQKMKRDRENDKLKKDIEIGKKNCELLEKEKEELANNCKDLKKKLDQTMKKLQQVKKDCAQLQQLLKIKDEEIDQTKQEAMISKETVDKMYKQLSEAKKKSDVVPQLRNKIIILQSRLKQNQSIYRDTSDITESNSLCDKIEALQHRLEEKDKEIKKLKGQIRNNSIHNSESNEEYQIMQIELTQREAIIEKLEQQLQKKQQLIEELRRQLKFKDDTLQFTHKILVSSEKVKIELEQEKKLLQEMIHNGSFEGNHQQNEAIQFYKSEVDRLQTKLGQMERRLKDRTESERQKDQFRFENRQLKERIKEMNEALLNKDRKFTPQMMSQEDTVSFLIKMIKKVIKSADMLRLLAKNPQFLSAFSRMQKQFRK